MTAPLDIDAIRATVTTNEWWKLDMGDAQGFVEELIDEVDRLRAENKSLSWKAGEYSKRLLNAEERAEEWETTTRSYAQHLKIQQDAHEKVQNERDRLRAENDATLDLIRALNANYHQAATERDRYKALLGEACGWLRDAMSNAGGFDDEQARDFLRRVEGEAK